MCHICCLTFFVRAGGTFLGLAVGAVGSGGDLGEQGVDLVSTGVLPGAQYQS